MAKRKMKKQQGMDMKMVGIAALVIVVIIAAVYIYAPELGVAGPKQVPTGVPSTEPPVFTEGVPDIGLTECLSQMREANPAMLEQDVRDNCYLIDAVNQDEILICENIVNAAIKDACTAQFE